MESLFLTIDLGGLLVLLLFSVRNERLPLGTAETGPFRIVPLVRAVVSAAAPVRKRLRRQAPRL